MILTRDDLTLCLRALNDQAAHMLPCPQKDNVTHLAERLESKLNAMANLGIVCLEMMEVGHD